MKHHINSGLLNQQMPKVSNGFVLMKVRTAAKKEFIKEKERLSLVALHPMQRVELNF
jgi:hypothetical protein